MNIEQILNMILRQVTRRLINTGINKGMKGGANALTRRRDGDIPDQGVDRTGGGQNLPPDVSDDPEVQAAIRKARKAARARAAQERSGE